jgi:hypothetical protein
MNGSNFTNDAGVCPAPWLVMGSNVYTSTVTSCTASAIGFKFSSPVVGYPCISPPSFNNTCFTQQQVSVIGGAPTVQQTITANYPVQMTVNTAPNTGPCATPCTLNWQQGATYSVTAPSSITVSGVPYTFSSWSPDGVTTALRSITASAIEFIATYALASSSPTAVTVLQTAQTVASGGAASFQVYVGQNNPSSSASFQVNWSCIAAGGKLPTVRPGSLTGSGWVTVIMPAPTVSTLTQCNFSFVATPTLGLAGQAAGTLWVDPAVTLQPDYLLSTTTSPLLLAQNVPTTLPVVIDIVDSYTGSVTFSSGTPGITAAGSWSPGNASVSVTLTALTPPATLTLIGKDSSGHVHQVNANCWPGGGGSGGSAPWAMPQTTTNYADVPIGGTSAPIPFGVAASLTVLGQLITLANEGKLYCSVGHLSITATGGYYIGSWPVGLYFQIAADDSAPQGPVPGIVCGGVVLYNFRLPDPDGIGLALYTRT